MISPKGRRKKENKIKALNPTLIKDINKIQAGWEIRVR